MDTLRQKTKEKLMKNTRMKSFMFCFVFAEVLTEVPGEADVAFQCGVVESVPAVHQAGARGHPDAAQGQQVGVLQRRAPGAVLDAPLQRAVAAVLRVAEDQRLPAVLFLTCTNAHNSMREYERHPLPKNNQHQI